MALNEEEKIEVAEIIYNQTHSHFLRNELDVARSVETTLEIVNKKFHLIEREFGYLKNIVEIINSRINISTLLKAYDYIRTYKVTEEDKETIEAIVETAVEERFKRVEEAIGSIPHVDRELTNFGVKLDKMQQQMQGLLEIYQQLEKRRVNDMAREMGDQRRSANLSR